MAETGMTHDPADEQQAFPLAPATAALAGSLPDAATDSASHPQKEKAPVAQPPKARPARKARDTRPRSIPYQETAVTLKTFHAFQTYERTQNIGTEALFTASVILRAFAPEADCVEVEKVIEGLIGKCKQALAEERKRLETLAETYAVALTELAYSSPQEVKMKVTSPRALEFMTTYKELDTLVEIFDILWFARAISNSDHSNGIYSAKRKVARLATDLRNLAIRSMAAAQRKDTDANDPREGTILDTSPKPATEQAGEAGSKAEGTESKFKPELAAAE